MVLADVAVDQRAVGFELGPQVVVASAELDLAAAESELATHADRHD